VYEHSQSKPDCNVCNSNIGVRVPVSILQQIQHGKLHKKTKVMNLSQTATTDSCSGSWVLLGIRNALGRGE